jgi:hypothetical protein
MNIEDLKESRGAHKHARRGAAWARGEFNSDVFSNPSDIIKHISSKGRSNNPASPSGKKVMMESLRGPYSTMAHTAKTVASAKPKMTSGERSISDTAKTVAEKVVSATAKTKALSVASKIPEAAKKSISMAAATSSGKTIGARPALAPKKAQAIRAVSDWRDNIVSGPRKVMKMQAIKGE